MGGNREQRHARHRLLGFGAALLSLLLLAFLTPAPAPAAVAAEPPPAAAPGTNRFTVHLLVRDGYLAVDPARLELQWTPAFRRLVHPKLDDAAKETRVRRELVDSLDRLFRARGRVTQQLLNDTARHRWEKRQLNRATFEGLDRTNASWEQARPAFEAWRLRHRDEVGATVEDVFRGLLAGGDLAEAYENSSFAPVLKSDDDRPGPEGIRRSYDLGRIRYDFVAAPITPGYVAPRAFRPSANPGAFNLTNPPSSRPSAAPADRPSVSDGGRHRLIGSNQLSRVVRPLAGSLWHRDRVAERIADYLEMRGFSVQTYNPDSANLQHTLEPPTDVGLYPHVPTLQADGTVADERIFVSPHPKLVGVFLRIPTNEVSRMRLALYELLPTPDFERLPDDLFAPGWLEAMEDPFAVDGSGGSGTNAPASTPSTPPAPAAPSRIAHLDLARGVPAEFQLAHTYVSRRFLAERLRYLAVAGLTASLVNTSPAQGSNRIKSVELLISPESRPAAASPTNRPSPVTFDNGTNFLDEATFEDEPSHGDLTTTPSVSYDPEQPNFLRVGVEHTPQRDLRYYVGYTRVGLAGDDALGGEVGFQGEALGSVTYHRDFVGFSDFGKRLRIALSGLSDFQPERVVDGVEFDERRSGGTARFDLELLRDRSGHWLSSSLSLGYRETTSQIEGERVGRDAITSADLGLLYFRQWDCRPDSARLEIEPILRAAVGDTNGSAFFIPRVDASYHQFVGPFSQIDVNGRIAWASDETPPNELPSLGGEQTVRGYRTDAFVGNLVWALQTEAWLPLRFRLARSGSLERFLRRNLALAAFVDVGGVQDTEDGEEGFKAGAGLGLRMVWADYLTVRLDWAHALDESDERRGGSMVYFTVTTRRGF